MTVLIGTTALRVTVTLRDSAGAPVNLVTTPPVLYLTSGRGDGKAKSYTVVDAAAGTFTFDLDRVDLSRVRRVSWTTKVTLPGGDVAYSSADSLALAYPPGTPATAPPLK